MHLEWNLILFLNGVSNSQSDGTASQEVQILANPWRAFYVYTGCPINSGYKEVFMIHDPPWPIYFETCLKRLKQVARHIFDFVFSIPMASIHRRQNIVNVLAISNIAKGWKLRLPVGLAHCNKCDWSSFSLPRSGPLSRTQSLWAPQ